MFDTEPFSKDYNEWLEVKEALEKKHREIMKSQRKEFQVTLNHEYLTSGKDIETTLVVVYGIKAASNFDENFNLSYKLDDLAAGKIFYKYYKTNERPSPCVYIAFKIATKTVKENKTNPDWKLTLNCNPDYDQSYYIRDYNELEPTITKEFAEQRTAFWNERSRDSLAYKMLQTSVNLKEKELDRFVKKCNVYLAEVLYKNVLTKMFSEEQIKKHFYMSEIPEETVLYNILAGRNYIEIPFGKDLYDI